MRVRKKGRKGEGEVKEKKREGVELTGGESRLNRKLTRKKSAREKQEEKKGGK